MKETKKDQAQAIWQGLIGYTRSRKDVTPEEIITLAPTFPQHMLGSTCLLDATDFEILAKTFIASDDFKVARNA